jgi:uncharacterized protein YjeT (DUF2065 family)
MKSMAVTDFVVGLGMLFVIEGLLLAALPNWMRQAMKSAIISPDMTLRIVGLISAVCGLIVIWYMRR